jgi:alcohol dehydrogenase
VSQMYAHEAWRLLSSNFDASLTDAGNVEVRGRMQLGAYLAGAAIECSMLGAAHAAANPLTARFDVTHGIAVAAMLPAVVHFNHESVANVYDELSPSLSNDLHRMRETSGRDFALGALGVDRASLAELAAEAATQWTATFNPRAVDENAFLSLYEACY